MRQRFRAIAPIAGVATLAVLLSGCAHHKFARKGPDEFSVARQAPLVIPPDFALRPPAPGAGRTNDQSPNAQALDALFGGAAPRSGAETATLAAAGGDSAAQGIRSDVGDPSTNVVDKGSTTRDIIAAPQGDGQDARAATK